MSENKKQTIKKSHNSVAKGLIMMLATKRSNKKHLTYEEMVDTIIGPIGTNKRKMFDTSLKRMQEELAAKNAEDQLALRNAKRSEEKENKRGLKKIRGKYKKVVNSKRAKIRAEQQEFQDHIEIAQ